jgi:peptidyl-Lys metalloendopeptidase
LARDAHTFTLLSSDPDSPLSTLDTNTFRITDASGASPAFKGAVAKFSPEAAAADGGFTVLEAGKSITIDHDLSTTYNFTGTGAGDYTFSAKNQFYLVKDDGSLDTIEAKTVTSKAKVSGRLAVNRAAKLDKRASFPSCTSSRQSLIVTAYGSAGTYASNAYSYLQSHTSATTRYTTWFGTYTSSRHSTVQSHYQKISAQSWSSFTYDCSCTDSGVYAYVYPDSYGEIYLCPVFWQVANTGTDSKAGTLVHESSHFTVNGGTDDHVYGQSGAKQLASSNPDQAVDNADNHEYFAENNPALS